MKPHRVFLIMLIAASLVSGGITPGGALAKKKQPESVVDLAVQGKFRTIAEGVKKGVWKGTVEHDLALALLEKDGNEAFERFDRIVKREDAPRDVKTVAWYHLYGYYRLVGDYTLQRTALLNLHENRELAAKLFEGPIPDPDSVPNPVSGMMAPGSPGGQGSTAGDRTAEPPPVSSSGPWSVQIGAFSTKERAVACAKEAHWTHAPVEIVPVKSKGKTLFTVRVGYFPDEATASRFGRAYFGKEGVDFRAVGKK